MTDALALEPNRLVRALGKPARDFTKRDLVGFIEANGIRMLNFRYVAGDGRLKKLNFVINGAAHLDRVLTAGERVDGSSLFSFIAADSSDLYVVPRYRSAFVNPFAEVPTLDLICSFYDSHGEPLESASEHILRKAQRALRAVDVGHRLDQVGIAHRRAVDGDLVGAGAQQRVRVVERAHAAAHRERREDDVGRAANDVEQDGPLVGGGRDVEEGDLVGAVLVVATRALDRIAGVAQADEVDPFDDAPLLHVEARDDPASQHRRAL